MTRPFRFSHGLSPPEEILETSQLFGIVRRTFTHRIGCIGSKKGQHRQAGCFKTCVCKTNCKVR